MKEYCAFRNGLQALVKERNVTKFCMNVCVRNRYNQ